MKIFSNFFKGDKRSVTIKKNIIGSLIIKGFSIVVSLLLVPLTLGYLSSELYGVWLTLSSIMMWLNFFDIGFTLGLKNKLTEALALHDFERGRSLVSTTYFMMILIFVPLCLILILLIPEINWCKFLNVPELYQPQIIKALYVLVVCFCSQMIVNVLISVIAAFQKVALSSVFPVLANFLSLIAIIIITKYCPPSLLYLAIAISVMPIVVILVASFILFSNRFKNVAPKMYYINRNYIKDLLGLGFKFFFIQVQVVILFQCTNILISNVSGPEEVTQYNIVYKYLSVAMMIYTIILSPLWPAFTDAYTKKEFVWMNNIYKKMVYTFLVSVCFLIMMILCSNVMYKIWIGDKVEIPFSLTIAVAIYMMLHSWDTLQVNMINGIGTLKLQTYVTLIGLVLHIPLSLLLGKYYSLGALGVIFSMILINLIYCLFFTTQIRKLLKNTATGIWAK